MDGWVEATDAGKGKERKKGRKKRATAKRGGGAEFGGSFFLSAPGGLIFRASVPGNRTEKPSALSIFFLDLATAVADPLTRSLS